MSHSLLHRLFSQSRAEILRLLFTGERKWLHLREIERLSSLTLRPLQRELNQLVKIGLLQSRKDGNRRQFAALTEHPLYQPLCQLNLRTAGLAQPLADSLEGLPGIEYAFVYGSAASGTETERSDIDLMVVGDTGLRALSPRLRAAADLLHREINPHLMPLTEWKSKASSGDAFLNSISKTPWIPLRGKTDELRETTLQWLQEKHPELFSR